MNWTLFVLVFVLLTLIVVVSYFTGLIVELRWNTKNLAYIIKYNKILEAKSKAYFYLVEQLLNLDIDPTIKLDYIFPILDIAREFSESSDIVNFDERKVTKDDLVRVGKKARDNEDSNA